MKLGKTSAYGMFAALYLAQQHGSERPVQGKDIAREYGIPVEYLLKILQAMARGGILRSERGRAGGFTLSREPGEISLFDILNTLEPQIDFGRLLSESLNGHQRAKSFLRDLFNDSQLHASEFLHRVTLEQLAEIDNNYARVAAV